MNIVFALQCLSVVLFPIDFQDGVNPFAPGDFAEKRSRFEASRLVF